jgi:serine/threonine protein kinase
MATVISIGTPVNESERQVIALLRDKLPSNYLILHNFEINRGSDTFEIDVAILAPHGIYLVDVKGTRGLIDVYGSKWYPDGRQPFSSPLLKLRSHARTLKGLITASQPGRRDLEDIFVDAVVILTAPDASLVDPSGLDAGSVTTLKKATSFFQNASRIPAGRSRNIAPQNNMVLRAIQGVAKARSGPLRFNNWEVTEKLGGTDAYVEYRAFNIFAGPRAVALLRVYQADPYLPAEEREAQRHRISNAYTALNSMPGHYCVVGVRDFFATESEDRYVLVTEDVPGQAIRIHVEKPSLALTFDQKVRVSANLLEALIHLRAHDVVHRNVTPSTVFFGTDNRARLIGFEFARAGTDRSRTIAQSIVDDLEPAYMAPEVHGEPSAASHASDVFSAGLVLYTLFTGERAFASPDELFDQGGVFPLKPSAHRPELPEGFDEWLQSLCTFEPDKRPTADAAAEGLRALLTPSSAEPVEADVQPTPEQPTVDYQNLPANTQLTPKYVVEERLGKPGSFGVVYKVVDTLGDVSRAMKLILRDRYSTLERLKKEYRTLLGVPDHPNVVKVIDADFMPSGGPPFIVFEYVNGIDVWEMIEGGLFAPEDVLELGRNVAAGLSHLHRVGVYHCDIKPRNLLWTSGGVKIIDFNVSVQAASGEGHGGGSRRYIPPDVTLENPPTPSELADRDLYALGLTLYEAATGQYPWETAVPKPSTPAPDPREFPRAADMSPDFASLILKAVSPRRADRFPAAEEMYAALSRVSAARRPALVAEPVPAWDPGVPGIEGVILPNTNPYVRYLLTLYSQSQHSNAGTRGLDAESEKTYVETALDRDLLPAVLAGEFKLVIISGNAGDGKTAFLQKLERHAEGAGTPVDRSLPNGSTFTTDGRSFVTNYDGSQDEGDRRNEDVLREFFAPFGGDDPEAWPRGETRLIAINEGRLVDFLEANRSEFPALVEITRRGLATGNPEHGTAVVNLNLRSVVTDPHGFEGSILERLVRRLTDEKFWEPCRGCDIRDRCYVFHNARTFQDKTAGPKVLERLKALYTITHLRGRLHVTVRDLKSALAFMLAGTRYCDEIHELYRTGRREEIAQGFYFNSWMGGDAGSADRLLKLLREIDVADGDDPRLDRALDFSSPAADKGLFRFEGRANYDRAVMGRLFDDLPRDYSGRTSGERAAAHRRFVGMARRRHFFERRDGGWRIMLPYATAERMLSAARGEQVPSELLDELLRAINRGEGLNRPERLDDNLALEVRRVEGGSIRSYRLFPKERFSLALKDEASRARFVEHMPTGLVLRYAGGDDNDADLIVTLDVFEMLHRLNEGYRPSVEEEQGYYLSLAVFKNLLGSAPYQEVLLTTTGHDFYRIARHADGRLEMNRVREGVH